MNLKDAMLLEKNGHPKKSWLNPPTNEYEELIQPHLVLTLLPPPQVFVHLVQGVHSVQVGHPSVLHGRISHVSPGHLCRLVPFEFLATEGSRQSRIRFVRPPPQVAVHWNWNKESRLRRWYAIKFPKRLLDSTSVQKFIKYGYNTYTRMTVFVS